jgi:hypothetical protein
MSDKPTKQQRRRQTDHAWRSDKFTPPHPTSLATDRPSQFQQRSDLRAAPNPSLHFIAELDNWTVSDALSLTAAVIIRHLGRSRGGGWKAVLAVLSGIGSLLAGHFVWRWPIP